MLEREDAVALARSAPSRPIGSVAELLGNSVEEQRDASRPFLLAPCDLQVIKAFGVTFASSLIERLIEEEARGNPAQAEAVRARSSRSSARFAAADGFEIAAEFSEPPNWQQLAMSGPIDGRRRWRGQ